MKNNYTIAIVLAIVFLIVGMFLGSYLFKQTITEKVNVPGECQTCDVCTIPEPTETPICVYDEETCAGVTKTVTVEKIVEKNTCKGPESPNQALINQYVTDTALQKRTFAFNYMISCDKYKERETREGRLIGNCWNNKRTIVQFVPLKDNTSCTVLSRVGC
jgi:hypothetical protein